jgi:ketosteroid isomerase-like protein
VTPAEIMKAAYAATRQGDWDEAERYLSDDLVIHEPEPLPYAGEWRGRDALRRLYGTVMGLWDDPSVETLDVADGEEWAVTLLELSATSRATGECFTTPIAEAARVEDGKIAEIRIHYFDPAEVARQAGER